MGETSNESTHLSAGIDLTPVSYTHLGGGPELGAVVAAVLGELQVLRPVHRLGIDLAGRHVHRLGATLVVWHQAGLAGWRAQTPVSYTHLDVYKRQWATRSITCAKSSFQLACATP